MGDERSIGAILGLTPQDPAIVVLPPIEADPLQPLPDAGAFVDVFSGVVKPSTAMMRTAVEFVPAVQLAYHNGGITPPEVQTQVDWMAALISREATGHTQRIAFAEHAMVYCCGYGDMVAKLAWFYFMAMQRFDDPVHGEPDAARLMEHIEEFDQLVHDVRAGTIRLPAPMLPNGFGTIATERTNG